MSSRQAFEKQRHGYGRYRTLARTLCARVFATAKGRLLLVGGAPDFDRLRVRLLRHREVPQHGQAPTPSELGFPAFCDGELTEYGLQIRGHALTKWSRALDTLRRHSTPNKRRAQQIANERAEIDRLRRRAAELYQWKRDFGSGDLPFCTPYLLELHDERVLFEALSGTEGDRRLSPLARWFSRIVMWTSGPTALLRYLSSLTPLLRSEEDLGQVEQIRTFRQQLRVWKLRCRCEGKQAVHAELRHYVRSMPPRIITAGKFSSRLRGRSMVEHCDLLIGRCNEMLKQLREIPACVVPAVMAALATCDGGRSPLPSKLVRECLSSGNHATLQCSVKSLHDEAGKPAYDNLLRALECLKQLPEHYEYENVRTMLATGATLDDIAWTQQQELVHWFDRRCLTPAWLRSFLDKARQRGILLEGDTLSAVLEAVKRKKDVVFLDQWLQWLRLPSETTLTPKNRQLITKGLVDLITPGLAKLDCHNRLQSWANPPTRRRYPIDVAAAEYPVLQEWLRRISFYQEKSGSKVGMPKSIRKQLDALNRQAREQAYLRRIASEGRADQAQLKRLQYLDKLADTPKHVPHSRLARTAEEAFIVTAVDALRAILRQAAEDTWRGYIGTDPPNGSLFRQISFADWIRRMDKDERELLRQILRAWSEHRAAYKQHLVWNQPWFAKVDKHNMDIENWLFPPPASVIVAGKTVRISVAYDPIEVFLMGSYFNTCLRLGDGNEMSVLANAHDANKQVLFMYDSQGNTQARQLVAVSKEFKFVGHHCYTVISHIDHEMRDKYIAAMASYCGRWARRCRLPLADSGEPAKIADHFWYDDGVWKWHEAARWAWAGEDGRIRRTRDPLESVDEKLDVVDSQLAG